MAKDPIRAYWEKLPVDDLRRQGRQLLQGRGQAGARPWRLILLVALLLAVGVVAVIYLYAWILVFTR